MKNTYKQFNSLLSLAIIVFVLSFLNVSSVLASEITPEKVIELVNKDRAANNEPALVSNNQLTEAARAKADDMVANQYFSHTSPNGLTPWHWIEQSGYSYKYAGENLAIHFDDAELQEQAWMNSPKHRENLLNSNYQDIGVAVKVFDQDGHKTVVAVQMFGLSAATVLAAQEINSQSVSYESAAHIINSEQLVKVKQNIASSDGFVIAMENMAFMFVIMAVSTMMFLGYKYVFDDILMVYWEIIQKRRMAEKDISNV